MERMNRSTEWMSYSPERLNSVGPIPTGRLLCANRKRGPSEPALQGFKAGLRGESRVGDTGYFGSRGGFSEPAERFVYGDRGGRFSEGPFATRPVVCQTVV